MPIIKDPVHNHQQGQYGVVFVETLGIDGALAVYDKSLDTAHRPLPTGWEVELKSEVKPEELDKPFYWCNVPIKYKVQIEDSIPAGAQGPISKTVKAHIQNNPHFGTGLKEPDSRNSIYPWVD